MTSPMAACVVDASVVIKLFVTEPASDRAEEFFAGLADGSRIFFVPDLVYIECANILWKHVRRFGLPRPEAEDALHRLRGLTLHATPTAELFEDALAIALDREISAYDASYVQLARARGVPLVTADETLVRKTGAAHDVQLLDGVTPTE